MNLNVKTLMKNLSIITCSDWYNRPSALWEQILKGQKHLFPFPPTDHLPLPINIFSDYVYVLQLI